MAFEKVKRNTEPEPVAEKTDKPRSNRRAFILAFQIIGLVWLAVFLFAICGIWAPFTMYGLAGNFTATAWLLGIVNAFATFAVTMLAQEFMDLKTED